MKSKWGKKRETYTLEIRNITSAGVGQGEGIDKVVWLGEGIGVLGHGEPALLLISNTLREIE
jgi:hypothetical protein